MIKFSKWMYELGWNAAIKEVLSVVSDIPNEKPREEDYKGKVKSEEQLHRKMSIAKIVYSERQALKDHLRRRFDPNYEPEVTDLAKIVFGDDDDTL